MNMPLKTSLSDKKALKVLRKFQKPLREILSNVTLPNAGPAWLLQWVLDNHDIQIVDKELMDYDNSYITYADSKIVSNDLVYIYELDGHYDLAYADFAPLGKRVADDLFKALDMIGFFNDLDMIDFWNAGIEDDEDQLSAKNIEYWNKQLKPDWDAIRDPKRPFLMTGIPDIDFIYESALNGFKCGLEVYMTLDSSNPFFETHKEYINSHFGDRVNGKCMFPINDDQSYRNHMVKFFESLSIVCTLPYESTIRDMLKSKFQSILNSDPSPGSKAQHSSNSNQPAQKRLKEEKQNQDLASGIQMAA